MATDHWVASRLQPANYVSKQDPFQGDRVEQLWISFSGYWPDRAVNLETCTFKDLEAHCVLGRLPQHTQEVLVVASAGNTALAFARACSLQARRCLIVVPDSSLAVMRTDSKTSEWVKLVALKNANYSDAIQFAERIAAHPAFILEGGVRNVARRDGLGTVLLSAAETIRRIPEYYFQAGGSGAGAIAVNESARRLIASGNWGTTLPCQILSQNYPFTPISDAWQTRVRTFHTPEVTIAHEQIRAIKAKVLSNRFPPYTIRGGVFDTLLETGGDVLVADNAEIEKSLRLFSNVSKELILNRPLRSHLPLS